MEYSQVEKGIFLERPNRFIALVEVAGQVQRCHVKNTGRCRELLVPGCTVYLERSDDSKRKTLYSVIAVEKGKLLINMDSQAPNRAVKEWLQSGFIPGLTVIRPETFFQHSRFDFYLETAAEKCFLEVKGVTLEEDGLALFPDAPTERGVKHLHELCLSLEEGYQAAVCFVIQMKGAKCFSPNRKTHPAFADALSEAAEKGVHIFARDCIVTPGSMRIADPVKIVL